MPPHTNDHRDPRLNALTHGLTADSLLDDRERLAFEHVTDTWYRELGSCCLAEDSLIRQAAIASVRLDRCFRAETASLALAGDRAKRDVDRRRRHSVRKLAQSLPESPRATLQALLSTPHGRDWVIARWQELDDTLTQGLTPTPLQRDRVLLLHGLYARTPGPDAPAPVLHLWWTLSALDPAPARPDDLQPPPDAPSNPIAARASLRLVVARQLETLHHLHAQPDPDSHHAQAVEEAVASARALIDTSPDALLCQRYEREASSTLNRSLSLLLRIRADRRRSDAEDRRASRSAPAPVSPSFAPNPSRSESYFDDTPVAPTPTPASPLRDEPSPLPDSPPQRTEPVPPLNQAAPDPNPSPLPPLPFLPSPVPESVHDHDNAPRASWLGHGRTDLLQSPCPAP